MEQWLVSSTVQGLEVRGTVLRLEKFRVVIELYETPLVLRVSELLTDCKVVHEGTIAYVGRALVVNILHLGAVTACELKLDEPGVQVLLPEAAQGYLERYNRWFENWQAQTTIRPEFRIAVLDLHGYLSDLKSVCEEMEVSILAHPSQARLDLELNACRELAGPVLASMDAMRERFLESVEGVPEDALRPYEMFVQRHLHPLFLCAPFGYRTYHKPLGYAGDYEMMNMIYRNGFEGGSLYARLVHHWLVNQPPACSVRNRIAHMERRLNEETLRALRGNHKARILNLGCGPAREVQDFLDEQEFSDHAEFTLLDFDPETLHYATSAVEKVRARHNRRTTVTGRRLSVTQLIKDSTHSGRNPLGSAYDLAYCGGLFDYLSPRVCKQMVSMVYNCLAPGGLLVMANMHDRCVLFSRMLEFLLDWHLIYRDARELESFVPEGLPGDTWQVTHEPVVANLFLEIRKPEQPES